MALYYKHWGPEDCPTHADQAKIGIDWWAFRGPGKGSIKRCGVYLFWFGHEFGFTLVKRKFVASYEHDMGEWKGKRLL